MPPGRRRPGRPCDRRPSFRRFAWALAFATILPLAAERALAQDGAADGSPPKNLVEQTRSRLAQIDVSVTGPPEVVTQLDRTDFRLKVHARWLDDFEVDRHCLATGATGNGASPTASGLKLSVLLYFDQPHLTPGGRARAVDLARRLVQRLVTDGHRAMIVSNASRLVVVEELTGDAEVLTAALDRLEVDRTQWDLYAAEEESRIERIVEVLNEDTNVSRAIGLARTFQREEHVRTDRSLRRLQLTLARMAMIDTRKVLVYFGDTLRQNPGEHYVSFFGVVLNRTSPDLGYMASEAFAGGSAFDAVINEAVTQGIRIYPVFAQGIVTPFDRARLDGNAMSRTGSTASSSRVRLRDAQATLGNMAGETGGHSFLRGETPSRIASAVMEDLACVYTLSFDPSGFPEDEPLRVILQMLREDVRIETRGRAVFQSESRRLSARLLHAFTTGESSDTEFGLRANLVPTGFERGSYRALLQVSVPPTDLADSSWDLGASLIQRDRVLDEVSGALAAGRPGLPLVLEREISIRPGPSEIVAVAHEPDLDLVLSEHVRLAWPDPNRRPLTCGPLALLQPTAGAFVRGEQTRTLGSLARSEGEPVSADQPTALMSLICRGRRQKGPLSVERVLIGDSAVAFPPLQFEFAEERCAQIRDLIPAGSLREGPYRYLLRVLRDGSVLDEATRSFVVATPET